MKAVQNDHMLAGKLHILVTVRQLSIYVQCCICGPRIPSCMAHRLLKWILMPLS